MKPLYSLLIIIHLCGACQKEKKATETAIQLTFNILNLELNTAFGLGQNRGFLQQKKLNEASGIAASGSNNNILWIHNDRGNPNYLYAVGKQNGTDFGFMEIEGATNRDWEDICTGPGPIEGAHYLYIGDIGDNDEIYPSVTIYRLLEPDIGNLDSVSKAIPSPSKVESIVLVYPDGPKDAEALMIDPKTKDLYIVTKKGSRSILYKAAYPYDTEGSNMLEKIALFPFARALAADISFDGSEIAIKTDAHIFYWKRSETQTILEALKQTPTLLPYTVYPQGEGFCWDRYEDGYFTISEDQVDKKAPLYFYKRN